MQITAEQARKVSNESYEKGEKISQKEIVEKELQLIEAMVELASIKGRMEIETDSWLYFHWETIREVQKHGFEVKKLMRQYDGSVKYVPADKFGLGTFCGYIISF